MVPLFPPCMHAALCPISSMFAARRRQQTRDRRWVNPKKPRSVCASLSASGDHPGDLGLLLSGQLWPTSADAASSRAASRPTLVRFLALPVRSPQTRRPSASSLRPAGVVVSIASVKLRKPAPASVSRSIMIKTSRNERESRSSFHTTSTSPLRS
jgi:hypothetical protein